MRKGRKENIGLEHPIYVTKDLFSPVIECDRSLGFKTSLYILLYFYVA